VDVVREQGEHIFGFIQDKTKVVYHYLASEHNLEQAVQALKNYIKLYGKPDAVRSDNGSEFKGEFLAFLNEKGIKPMRPLPYNPGANGFIERYFRTLRKDLFRKLRANHLLVSQKCLDEFAFIKNHCSTVGKTGQTPAEMARLENNTKLPENFQFEQVSMHDWNFWHIKGIHGLMHAYAVFVNKVVRFFHAALLNFCSSARTSFGGFSHTSVTGLQSLISPDHRCGFFSLAAS